MMNMQLLCRMIYERVAWIQTNKLGTVIFAITRALLLQGSLIRFYCFLRRWRPTIKTNFPLQ
jgi:hypothetical protein